MPPKKTATARQVTALAHEDASRKHIPTVENQCVMPDDERSPVEVACERRNRDLAVDDRPNGSTDDRHNGAVAAITLRHGAVRQRTCFSNGAGRNRDVRVRKDQAQMTQDLEPQARERVDQLLRDAGWRLQPATELNRNAAPGVAVRSGL